MRALVKGTLVLPAVDEEEEDAPDVQDDIEQQVSLGDHEEAYEEAP
jgi:hypothetical protein